MDKEKIFLWKTVSKDVLVSNKEEQEDEAVHAGNRGEQEEEVDRTASSLA